MTSSESALDVYREMAVCLDLGSMAWRVGSRADSMDVNGF